MRTKKQSNTKPQALAATGRAQSDSIFVSGWAPTSKSTHKDIELSLRVSVEIQAVPRQCWFNCRRVVQRHIEFAEASYVEGWVVRNNCPSFEHAWLIYNGTVIDPTLPDMDLDYYPGLEFRGRAEIEEFLATKENRKCKNSPFFYAFGWGGYNSPSFRLCTEKAQVEFLERHRCTEVTNQGRLPESTTTVTASE